MKFTSKKFGFSPRVELLECRMQPGSIWFGGGSLLGSDLNLNPQQDLADELVADHQRRMPVDTTSSVELVTTNTGTIQTGALVQSSPVQLNHDSVATPVQNPFARSTALDMAAMNHATSRVSTGRQATRQAPATQEVQQQSAAVTKNHDFNPTVQSEPVSILNGSTRIASVPSQALNLQASKLHLNFQGGPAIPSTPNFSRYVGITNENHLDGIAILQDGSGNLGATGLSQVGSAKSILVATVASDATSGSSGTLTLSSDATGVGIDSDAAGNLYVSATLSTGATNTGIALIKIDTSGTATALTLTGMTSGSAGYLRFNPTDGLVYFSGGLDGDILEGTVDSTNWDPSGASAFTVAIMDSGGNHLVSSAHSVALDNLGNTYYAITVNALSGESEPGLLDLSAGVVITFPGTVGTHSGMYDVTVGTDPVSGVQTVFASGTINTNGTNDDNLISLSWDGFTATGVAVTVGAGSGINGYGLAIDAATENVYIADNNYATLIPPFEANAGWIALSPNYSIPTIVDTNSDPFDDIFGTFDDRDRGIALTATELYMAGYTNSPDFNFLAPSSPPFGGTPEGRFDSIWISYHL